MMELTNSKIFIKKTGCSEEDAAMYLFLAERFLLSETRRTSLNSALETAQLDLAIVLFNREGTEGEVSRSEGGISISVAEVPVNIQRTIAQYRLARVGGHAFEKKSDATNSTKKEI